MVQINLCHVVKWLYRNIDAVWKFMFKSHEAEINPCNLTHSSFSSSVYCRNQKSVTFIVIF